MKSNERAMERWPLFYTHLKNSPMMKTGDLWEQMCGQVSHTDFYNFLGVYEQKEKIIRPSRGLIMLVKKPGFLQRLIGWKGKERRKSKRELLAITLAFYDHLKESGDLSIYDKQYYDFYKKLDKRLKDIDKSDG